MSSKNHLLRPTAQALLICLFASTASASATISNALITRIQHEISSPRGPNGRAWIAIDRTFPLTGNCLYAGTVNGPAGWMLEFDTEHGSFKSFFASALAAYSSGRTVEITYDDGFGAGTTCRITGLVVSD